VFLVINDVKCVNVQEFYYNNLLLNYNFPHVKRGRLSIKLVAQRFSGKNFIPEVDATLSLYLMGKVVNKCKKEKTSFVHNEQIDFEETIVVPQSNTPQVAPFFTRLITLPKVYEVVEISINIPYLQQAANNVIVLSMSTDSSVAIFVQIRFIMARFGGNVLCLMSIQC
jgi:hypothetical protein